MRVVAIIQARMGSTRLPGKVLKGIGGSTMLAHVVCRLRQAVLLNEVVVATTVNSVDEVIVAECTRLGAPVFRGDEDDVLDRFYQAAQAHRAELVVRVTADCPLIDPGVVDKVIGAFLEAKPHYASNTLERTYPRGLDTEVVDLNALERAWFDAQEPYQRVHVTPYLYQNPNQFRLLSVTNDRDYSYYRWTVDTSEDLRFVQEVYGRLGNDDSIKWTDVLTLLRHEPALVELNRAIRQKTLHEG